jgi:hypothetical protein
MPNQEKRPDKLRRASVATAWGAILLLGATACGEQDSPPPPGPTLSSSHEVAIGCQSLEAKLVSPPHNTYSFTAQILARGITAQFVSFDFGDGNTRMEGPATPTPGGPKVFESKNSYKHPGKFMARVTSIRITEEGRISNVPVPSSDCQLVITAVDATPPITSPS